MATYSELETVDSTENDDCVEVPPVSEKEVENGDSSELQCTFCGKSFRVEATLQRHYRTHTGDKPFSCDYCSKQFTVKENLNVHRRCHTKERPYICSFCNRGFEHSGKLHRHMRTHTGERPHKCEICNKTFVQSGQLVIHMRAHRGEKPYTCEYCDKGFTCSKQLKVHIRIHTGEKPYECDTCGKTFGYNHVLKMHKLSHLGEKLYKCTLCEKFFSSRKMFDRHLKSHSKEDTSIVVAGGSKGSPNDANDNGGSNKPPSSPGSSVPVSSDSAKHPKDDSSRRPSMTYAPVFSPLTPPRSPHIAEQLSTLLGDPQSREGSHFPGIGHVSIDKTPKTRLRLAVFSSMDGDRWACPADLVIHMQGKSASDEAVDEEREMIENELQKRLSLDTTNETQDLFCTSVVKVLESCLGLQRLQQLGYPNTSIDEVIMKTLQLLGSHPCWEPSLSSMDRMKVNLRILLELCIPDADVWAQFGWRGKSIEEIIMEILDQC